MQKLIEVIVNQEEYLTNNKWDTLWEILDEAKDTGISYIKHSPLNRVVLPFDPDATIYVDIEPQTYNSSAPYVVIDSLDASDEYIISKVQELAKYIFAPEAWIPPTLDSPLDAKTKIYAPLEINVGELIEFTNRELEVCKIKGFSVNIDGKEIILEKEELYTLAKLYKIIDRFGYKVTKVLV